MKCRLIQNNQTELHRENMEQVKALDKENIFLFSMKIYNVVTH